MVDKMSLQVARRLYDKQRSELEGNGYVQLLTQRFRDLLPDEPTLPLPKKAICLALMHVAHPEENDPAAKMARVDVSQLIAFEAMLAAFAIPPSQVTIYDPCFNELDRLLLRELGYVAPELNSPTGFGTEEKPNLPVLEQPTLVFSPNCQISQLYRRNWSAVGLSNIIWIESSPEVHMGPLTSIWGSLAHIPDKLYILLDPKVSEAHEPQRRAAMLAEERALPSYHSVAHKHQDDCSSDQSNLGQACTSYRQVEDGYHLDLMVAKLCWIPKERLEATGKVFWRIEPMEPRLSEEDLE